MQITQPILPSKIYAPAGIASAKQHVSDDVGVTGLVPLPLGGLGVALSTVGGLGTPGGSVMYNMGAPSALTGLEAVPQDHVIQGIARFGPYLRQYAVATGKPGEGGSKIWISNEANTAFSLRATLSATQEILNLAEYYQGGGAIAGTRVMFSYIEYEDPGGPYVLCGHVNVRTGAVTTIGPQDISETAGSEPACDVFTGAFGFLGDLVDGGNLYGAPSLVTLDTQLSYSRLEVGRSPDTDIAGPYSLRFRYDFPAGTYTVEAFNGYLGGTNCLLLVGGATDSYLFRSTDKGLTWAPAGSFPHSCIYGRGHIHWLTNLEVFLSIGSILYYSRDGGGSWRKIIDVGDEVTALTGMADGSIYAGTQNGVIHRYAPLYW